MAEEKNKEIKTDSDDDVTDENLENDEEYESDGSVDDPEIVVKTDPKPTKRPKKKSNRGKKKTVTIDDNNTMLATTWIDFYNSVYTGEVLTIPRLVKYLNDYNDLQRERGNLLNVVKSTTRDGLFYVETSKMLMVARTIRELRIIKNEERKINIAYTAKRRALILETRAEQEALIWGNLPNTYDEFCERIASAANQKLLVNSSIRNSRNQFVFITAQEIKDFGIKKKTITEVAPNGCVVEMSNKFFAQAQKGGERDEEYTRLRKLMDEHAAKAQANASGGKGEQLAKAGSPR